MSNPFYKMYEQILLWGENHINSASLIKRHLAVLIESILSIWAALFSRIKGIQFPTRVTGSKLQIANWRVKYLMGWSEYETLPYIKHYVHPGMTVLDIGAHIGYYTNLLIDRLGSTGKLYAFEASPENYSILIKNTSANKRKNVFVYQVAVSDHDGVLNLYVSPGHSNHSLVKNFQPSTKIIPVQSVRLDTFLDVQKIDFVKMDIEGAEPLALNGMRRLIQASPNMIMIIEYNSVALAAAYSSPRYLLNLLDELGFQYKAILPNGDLGTLLEDKKTINLLCFKK